MKLFPRFTHLALALAASMLLVTCGGDSSTVPPPAPPPAPTPPSAPPEPEPESPAAPAGLHVSAIGVDFVEWSWTPVEGADGYDVQFTLTEAFTDEDEIIARTAEETSYRREELEAGTSYFLRVRSAAGTGEERITSEWSLQVTGLTAAPPPEPPDQPTGVRVAERGPDFLVWTWDPVGGATSYQGHAFAAGTPPEERPPLLVIPEPTFRVDGLEPGAVMGFYVRAIRETAGGRAAGTWSKQTIAQALPPPARACTDQRDRALTLSYGHRQVVHEWDPDRPIRFRVDAGPIIEGGRRIGHPDFLEEKVLQPLRDMARRLEERLGYTVMESPDVGPGGADNTVRVAWRDHVHVPTWAGDRCPPNVGSPWNAQGTPPAVFLNRYIFDPEIVCSPYEQNRVQETIIHELAHVFGMGHSAGYSYYDPDDLAMSEPLTVMTGGKSDNFLLAEDLDNIGCVFPHPAFPRD